MASEQSPSPVLAELHLRVNGREHELVVDTRTSLLDLLRERLGHTGTKKGCDHGQCGACTVLIDGRRANACLALVHTRTGEVRVPRVLGVFAAGAIINAKTARSQFIGGMTMGIGMALLEESILDREFGDYLNHDLASYHVASYADIEEIDALWIDERDERLNPMGSKGIGEIGIVGTAAAVANAVHRATGVRFRSLPIRIDRTLPALGLE
jgi:CO/xanthine dehydrogenase Mo-binding subunit